MSLLGLLVVAGVVSQGNGFMYAQQPPTEVNVVPDVDRGLPTFSVNVDLVTTDVIVRDDNDQFISNLTAEDFEIYEDGVRQEVASLTLVNGGRVFNILEPPSAPIQEGVLLPSARPVGNQAAGRVFLIFVDDLHLDFGSTPKVRELFTEMLENLIHEGDMFGLVTTGTSSLSIQLTYDRDVLRDALSQITGSALRQDYLLLESNRDNGSPELRFRARSAFETAYKLMINLEQLRNRRKAVIWLSSGYMFNPFEQTRLQMMRDRMGLPEDFDLGTDAQSNQALLAADLTLQLSELTRAANRANATVYTIDPRGLVGGPPIDLPQVNGQEWQQFVRETQTSLRYLAEATGGIALVNTNSFERGLRRIDAETSDYYVIGYYSSNSDLSIRTRALEVRTSREDVNVWSRSSYTLRDDSFLAQEPVEPQ